MGVFYEVRVYLADNEEDCGRRDSTVGMSIKKYQYSSPDAELNSPTSIAEKGFLCGSGMISLEANLDKDVYYHGEDIPVHISVDNQSQNSNIKNISVSIMNIIIRIF